MKVLGIVRISHNSEYMNKQFILKSALMVSNQLCKIDDEILEVILGDMSWVCLTTYVY